MGVSFMTSFNLQPHLFFPLLIVIIEMNSLKNNVQTSFLALFISITYYRINLTCRPPIHEISSPIPDSSEKWVLKTNTFAFGLEKWKKEKREKQKESH